MIDGPIALVFASAAIQAASPVGRLLSILRPRRPDIAAAAALLASTPLYHLDPALIGTPPRAIVTRA